VEVRSKPWEHQKISIIEISHNFLTLNFEVVSVERNKTFQDHLSFFQKRSWNKKSGPLCNGNRKPQSK